MKMTKATGSTGRMTSISLRLVQEQDDQRADQQHERLHGHQQPLADEQAHLLDVVGGADHQLAGLVAVVVAEREALDLGEQLVAEVEGHALRHALRHVALAEGEEAAR